MGDIRLSNYSLGSLYSVHCPQGIQVIGTLAGKRPQGILIVKNSSQVEENKAFKVLG